jgi:SacI homology domain.
MAPYYGLPLKYCDGKESDHDVHHSIESSFGSQIDDRDGFSQVISDKLEENLEDARDIDIEKIFNEKTRERSSGDFELSALSANVFPDIGSPPPEQCFKSNIKTKVFRGIPTEKFVWNSYILEDLKEMVHPDWLLNIIHGFVGQSSTTPDSFNSKYNLVCYHCAYERFLTCILLNPVKLYMLGLAYLVVLSNTLFNSWVENTILWKLVV